MWHLPRLDITPDRKLASIAIVDEYLPCNLTLTVLSDLPVQNYLGGRTFHQTAIHANVSMSYSIKSLVEKRIIVIYPKTCIMYQIKQSVIRPRSWVSVSSSSSLPTIARCPPKLDASWELDYRRQKDVHCRYNTLHDDH